MRPRSLFAANEMAAMNASPCCRVGEYPFFCHTVCMHGRRYFASAALLFASGFAGLIYEVLWMKQLGLLFGNTSYAAAATLSAFFLGLAAGALLWGRRAAWMGNPLRWYAILEAGIALTAPLYFLFLPLYHLVYPLTFQAVGVSPVAIAVKFCLSLLLVFPPALLMGGTVPLMSQHLIRDARQFGTAASGLYGVNTLGAALGAYVAGFHLPLYLGYRGAYGVALCVTLSVAIVAWLLSRFDAMPQNTGKLAREAKARSTSHLSPRFVASLSFLSGFGVLGFEVLWTRMFAQVLQNSVYTFAAVLVTILVCLALGAGFANRLARLAWSPARVLFVLLLAAGLSAGSTPPVFMYLTDNMRMVGSSTGWGGYMLDVFRTTVLVMGVPSCLLGTVFPYLLKTCESRVTSAGRTLGELSALNTLGAILGALFAGFLLLDWVGLWPGIRFFSLLYFLPLLVFPVSLRHVGLGLRAAAAAILLLSVFALDPSNLPRALVNELDDGEELVAVFEGSAGTVAVTRIPVPYASPADYPLAIKLNNHYPLGSNLARMSQEAQTCIPLTIRPETRSVYFLGMGTGITADAALAPCFLVERTVTCEMSPEVVAAVREHFGTHLQALLDDKRSEIVIDDGRHHLACTPERFDLINADLFNPHRSDAGSLYTVEHFRAVKRRLSPHGMFVQWLPLYQLTREEFGIIARTMLEVFPQVTLWRGGFFPGKEFVGLIGHPDRAPLPAIEDDGDRTNWARLVEGKTVDDVHWLELPLFCPRFVLVFYCGNLSEIGDRFDRYPLNTDDHPLIEYMAPLSRQRVAAGQASCLVGEELAAFLEELHRACPPERDPMLANRSPIDRLLPRAGLSLYKTRLYCWRDRREKAEQAWEDFARDWRRQ